MGGIGACLGTLIYPGLGTVAGEIITSAVMCNLCSMESSPLSLEQRK